MFLRGKSGELSCLVARKQCERASGSEGDAWGCRGGFEFGGMLKGRGDDGSRGSCGCAGFV